MPVIAITLLPGYGAETEARLVQRVALAARSVIAAPAAGTTVMVHHASTYQRDGRVVTAGGAARPDASALVRRFLDHMQARDLTQAQQCLAPGFVMRFPGAPRCTGSKTWCIGQKPATSALPRWLTSLTSAGPTVAPWCTARARWKGSGLTDRSLRGCASLTALSWSTG